MTEIKGIKSIEGLIISPEMVIVKLEKVADTLNGIILPDSAKKDIPARGVVVAIGTKIEDLNVGDIILDVVDERVIMFEFNTDKHLLVPRHFIRLATRKDNYGESFE